MHSEREAENIQDIYIRNKTLKIPSCVSSPWWTMRCLCAWEHLELIYDRSVLFSHTALYETCKSPLANSTMAQHPDSAQPAHKSDLSNVSTKKKADIKSWTHSVPCQIASASLPSDWQKNSRERGREKGGRGRVTEGTGCWFGGVWRDKLGASFNVHREWVTNHHPRLRAHPKHTNNRLQCVRMCLVACVCVEGKNKKANCCGASTHDLHLLNLYKVIWQICELIWSDITTSNKHIQSWNIISD